jgi:hypothetical protein
MRTTNMIRLDAGHTTSGNPRRVFVGLSREGTITGAWDEGYSGWNAVPEKLRKLAQFAPRFDTTPSEYNSLLRNFAVAA